MAKKIKTQLEERLMLKQEREKIIGEMLRYSKKRFKKFDEVIVQLNRDSDRLIIIIGFNFSSIVI